jgi:hypothetical protein
MGTSTCSSLNLTKFHRCILMEKGTEINPRDMVCNAAESSRYGACYPSAPKLRLNAPRERIPAAGKESVEEYFASTLKRRRGPPRLPEIRALDEVEGNLFTGSDCFIAARRASGTVICGAVFFWVVVTGARGG